MEDFWVSNENEIYLSQLPLEVDCYGIVVNTTLIGNSTTIDVVM
jgi:hypothetical protein